MCSYGILFYKVKSVASTTHTDSIKNIKQSVLPVRSNKNIIVLE